MKRLIIAAALMLVACAANADDERKFIAGVAASFSDYEGDPSYPVNDSGLGMQFFAQARVNSWFGLEGAYYNSGDFTRDIDPANNGVVDISLRGLNISAIGYIPIFPNAENDMEFFGKLGLYDYDIDTTTQNGASRVPGSLGHETGLLAGAGIILHISDGIGIRTDVNYYDIDNADLWSLNMGVQITF